MSKRTCAECGGLLVRRSDEQPGKFSKRRFCKIACAARAGSRKAAEIALARDESELQTIQRNGYEMRFVRGRLKAGGGTSPGGGRYVYAHRLVMEEALGRELRSEEIVHHLDGDPLNNAPENLALTDRSEHAREHIQRGDWFYGQPGPRPDLRQPVRVQLWARCLSCGKWWARARKNARCCSVSCANRAR